MESAPPDEQYDEHEDPVYRSPMYRTELELIRVLLANDVSLADVKIDEGLFASDEAKAIYARVSDIARDVPPGDPLDLGAAIGAEDTPQAQMMSELALIDRPLPDAEDLVNRLEVGRIDAQIAAVTRNLRQVDEEADPQRYSELWRELISLQQDKRVLRSDR